MIKKFFVFVIVSLFLCASCQILNVPSQQQQPQNKETNKTENKETQKNKKETESDNNKAEDKEVKQSEKTKK